jgi:hypothetical protein
MKQKPGIKETTPISSGRPSPTEPTTIKVTPQYAKEASGNPVSGIRVATA